MTVIVEADNVTVDALAAAVTVEADSVSVEAGALTVTVEAAQVSVGVPADPPLEGAALVKNVTCISFALLKTAVRLAERTRTDAGADPSP